VEQYEFVTRWFLETSSERVWKEMADMEAWPSWWPGVEKMQVRSPGDADGRGRAFRNVWRSKLPYTLEFDTRVTRIEPHALIEASISGGLEGTGRWVLATHGTSTLLTMFWIVKTNKAWMNWLAPVARPLFEWNHGVIMRWGEEALTRRLGLMHR
jgi:ribosome-associated toxin RatA of RatAB toxin-antitoxin module